MHKTIEHESVLVVKPLVTFALFAFNQERFIRAAVEGALAQDYSPLELIISDDCSTDKTVEIIEDIIKGYHGPHKIIFNINKSNMGLIGHVNNMFQMASGELIVAAAGDDVSLPRRTTMLADIYFESKPMLIHSSVIKIDENGNRLEVFRPELDLNVISIQEAAIALSLYIGATAAWSKLLYSNYGPIVYSNAYEDLVFGFRALLSNSVAFVDHPLVMYRVGSGLSTKKYDFSKGFLLVYFHRCRSILVNIDVYSQRLCDLCVVGNDCSVFLVKSVLMRRIILQKNKLDFYKNPLNLFENLFKKDFLLVIVAVTHEIIYSIKIIKKYVSYVTINLFKQI